MIRPSWLLRLLLLVAGCASGAADDPVSVDGASLAIVNVNAVPMDGPRLLPDQTVVIRDGVIARVGPSASTPVPAGATVVDGTGLFLMPGLVDMHIHAVAGVGEEGDGAWQQMSLLVANGVTTARSLAGAPTATALRENIRSGRLVGPELYLAGPSLNHRSVATPDAARVAVREQKAAGFDFLKTHGVTGPVYAAIVEAAAGEGIRLVGHVTPDYGLDRALAAGQQIEHLDGYLAATIAPGSGVAAPAGQVFFGPELDAMRESAMPALARRTAEAGVWNSPTLALFEVVADPRPVEAYLAMEAMGYVPDNARTAWAAQVTQMAAAPVPPERRARYLELRRAMTRALRDAGAGLMAGSDSPQLFMAPGFALHDELAALQRAGLTPYEALAAATVNPARYVGGDAAFGVIAEGGEADLLLLEANPLDDVANARAIAGVVLDGRWLPAAALAELKAAVRAAAGGAASPDVD